MAWSAVRSGVVVLLPWGWVAAIACAGTLLARGASSPEGPAAITSIPATSAASYAGSSNCRECHQKFYELWSTSHHGLAMQPFSSELGRARLHPQPAPLKIGNASYQVDLERAVVREQTSSGEKQFAIAHAMGGKNVFFFLTPLERGRLQVLPLAFDVRRQVWFDMAASAVRHFGGQPDSALDWRDPLLTFNTACYNCHVSQLSKNYDIQTDSYDTRWKEPGINCETCHGPASAHIEIARATPPGRALTNLHLIVTSTFTPSQMNSLCGSCHAKMFPITSSFAPGERFYDHFGLITLEDPDFYPDGRDLGENFTETTWRLSECFRAGKLDCTHCHTSSGRFRFQGERVNHACLPCHQRHVETASEHSHHPSGSAGAQCVSCHMPVTEFARMRRSDHSMRPPMPAATQAHGSPNACNLCHPEKDAAWADRTVREWRPRDYQAPVLQRAAWIAAARKQDWSMLPAMVQYLSGSDREEIWAASLIQLLRPCDDERKWAAILACLKDSSPLVRGAAVEACGDRLRPDMIQPLLLATRDSFRLVRIRAASALASLPREALSAEERARLEAASREWRASLLARPDDPASHYNLGNFHMEQSDFPQALDAFHRALRLQPQHVPALVNMSLVYNAMGRNMDAEEALRRALRYEPTNAVANLNAGMLLAELGKMEEAEKAFRAALASDPRSAVAAYNLGVLLGQARLDEALVWCRRAAELRPGEAKYFYTLAFFLAQRGEGREAIRVLEKGLERAPGHLESYGLLGRLYEQHQQLTRAAEVYQQAAADPALPAGIRQQFEARARQLFRR